MNTKGISRNLLWPAILVLVALAYFFGPDFANWVGGTTYAERPHFAKGQLTLQKVEGQVIPLKVEIAKTNDEKAYGLMYIKSLPHDAGMIFLWDNDQILSFWMENTLIPLDMIFIDHGGSITKIVKNTKPLDLSAVSSDVPVRGVLEINGGDSEAMGIRVGDRVLFPGFDDNP